MSPRNCNRNNSNSRNQALSDLIPGSHYTDIFLLSDDAITSSDDDFNKTGANNQTLRNLYLNAVRRKLFT